MPRPSDERCDELVARSPSRTAGVNHLIDHVSAATIRGEHDHRMLFAYLVPTNEGLKVAELRRRPTPVPESGGCLGLST